MPSLVLLCWNQPLSSKHKQKFTYICHSLINFFNESVENSFLVKGCVGGISSKEANKADMVPALKSSTTGMHISLASSKKMSKEQVPAVCPLCTKEGQRAYKKHEKPLAV